MVTFNRSCLPKIVIPNASGSGSSTSPVFKSVMSPVSSPREMTRIYARSFYNKVGLGIESRDTIDFFLQHKLSTAMNGTLARMEKYPEKYGEQIQEFNDDFKKARGHELPPEHAGAFGSLGMPWQIFKQADQTTLLKESGQPYVKYYRDAIETAFARDGKVYFHLGGTFEVKRYIEDIINTEANEKMAFSDYVDNVSYHVLAELDRGSGSEFDNKYEHSFINPHYLPKPAVPGITNIEVFDLTTGSFKHYAEKVQYFSHDGVQLDTKEFLNRHAELLRVTTTKENRQRVDDDEPMTEDATKAIEEFQRYIRGASNLPIRGMRGAWRSE